MFIGSRTRNVKIDYGYRDGLTDAELLEAAKDALTHPSDAAFWDDSLYKTHTLMFYSAPASDDLVSQSNHRRILEDLQEAYPRQIEAASVRHWTYSHYDCIKIRVTYADGEITPAFNDAMQIAQSLDSYPLYDENDYSELEMEEWDRAILSELSYATSDIEWSESHQELAIEFFYSENAQLIGYHDVGYIPDDTTQEAIEHAQYEMQRVKELGLSKTFPGTETLAGL